MRLLLGDLRDVLPTLEPASFDAVVTDPPYELGFMGKAWDRSGVAFQPETWEHVLRVLKPVELDRHYLRIAGARMRFWGEHGEDGLRVVAERDRLERVRRDRADAGQLDLFGEPR